MNRDELLKKYNVEAPKGKTIAEILQDRQTQKVNNYIQSYNNAINKYGNLSKTDLMKYGDYSGTKQSFSDLYEEIGTLKTNLNSIKGYISEKNYDQIFKSLTDIQGTVKSNIEVTQNAIDFYGKFENEESYNLAIEYSKADLDSLKTEITNLEAGYNAAKALQENINAYTNRANVYRKRSNGLTTDGGNQKRADSYKAQLKQLLAKYGYSSLSEFEKAISSKQSFYNNAFEMQNTQRISEVSNPESKYYDPEFDKFSQVGKIVYSSISLKAKQTINGAARTGSVEYFNNLKKTSEYYDKILHRFDIAHMTEDEKEIFYYYVGKFAQQANRGNVDESIINDYVDTIQAAINYISAVKINEKLKDNKIAQYALGAYAGISKFTENVENAFDTSGKKKTASNIEIASQINREKNLTDDGFSFWYNIKTGKWEGKILGNSLGQIAYDLMNTTAYMAPSMIVSNIPVVGKGLGLATTGLAAYGGAYQEKINEGYTKKQARTYGVLVGTSEATLQYLIGGISKLGGKFSKKAITNLVDKVDKALAKVALEIELSSNSEALEEGMQTFLEPLFHTIATGETFESAKWNDVLYSALLGKLNSYALESGPVIQNATNETLVGNAIVSKGEVDNVLLAAASMGKLDPEIAGQVDALTKYAKKHNGAVNNATYKRMLGKVAVAIAQNSTDVKQNIIESAIKSALSKRGIDGKVLSKIINAVSKYITGQRLTSAEQGFIKNNSVAGELIREIAAAQKVVNSEASQKADMMNETAITENGENNTSSTAVSGGAPEWAVTLVRQLNLIDGATEIVNAAVTGKTKEEAKTQERNRMIKLLSIASGKTTAQQEAEAGDIPYSQYIKQKEAEQKENTAEDGGEGSEKTITEGGEKYSIKYPTFSEEEMIENAMQLQEMEPVKELTGEEFPKSDIPLRKRIMEFFDSLGNNVSTELFGDVALTSSSVHDDLGHGTTNNKVVSFAAVPEVIQKGVVIDSQRRGGNNYDRIVVAAPIKIGSEEYVMGVMLQRDHQSQRLYLHDVVSVKKEETTQTSETTPSSTEVSKKGDSLYMTSILQKALSVKKDYMRDGRKNTTKAKEISEADRKKQAERKEKVKSLCDLFGLSLEWDEEIKRGKYNPKNRMVSLNPNLTLTEMYIEVLKHEFTHDLENRRLYKKFKEYLFNSSENFIKFCEEEINELKKKGIIGEAATGKDAVLIYRGHIYEVYKNSKEMNGEERAEFDGEAAEREMICNFVSKRLLSRESETECIEALKELAEKQRTVFDRFMDLIRNFIYHIKQTFNKATEADELEYLERRLKQVYDSKIGKNKTAQGGVKYSTGMTFEEQVDNVLDNNFDKNNHVYIGETPQELINILGIKNLPMLATSEHIYAMSVSEEQAKEEGRYKKDKNYHDLGEKVKKLPQLLKSPILIIKANENTKDSTFIVVTNENDKNGNRIIAVVKPYGKGNYYNVEITSNVLLSAYGKHNITNFVNKAFKENRILYSINSNSQQKNTTGVQFSNNIMSADYTNNLAHFKQIVNSNSMQENEKYSIDLEENVSEREETEDVSEEKNSADNKSIDIPAEAMKISNRYFKGEITKEEYQTEINDLLAKSGEKYGVFETGELAENKKQIPKKVTDDEYVRRMVRTIIESGTLPEDIETDVLAEALKNALSYKRISNKKAQTQADLAVQDGTAVKQWEAAVNGDSRVGKKHIAIGETLLKMAAEQNDARAVMKLVCEISEMATRAGQTVQAFSMLKRMDGIGKLYYLQKCVDNINKDLQDRFLKKYSNGKLDKIPQVKINETLASQLAQSKTKKDFDVTYEALLQSIAAQVPTTFIDKWNAWRYFSMLFNSRTHIRNFFGNVVMLPTARLKDVCAAVIENFSVEEQKRTKSVVVKKEYLNFGKEDYANIEDTLTGSGKMNPSNAIKDRQTVFKPKWLEALRKWNFELLEKEDTFFLKKHYAHAMGGFLQARKIDISASIPFEVIEEARFYAMEEAAKATYRDTSALANAIQRFSRKNVFLNLLVEGNLPFKKTPINIVKRGIEYSPIGLIKTLTKGTYDLKKENISASEYIDGIAGGLTGTGIMLMGMLLSSLGFIKFTGGFGDDEEDDINKLIGRQEYAIEIGGISYTIDWMAPACIPLFIGVELQNALEQEGNGNLWQSIKNVAGNSLEPIINLSMLSGIDDLIFSAKYTKEDAVVGTIAWEVALNYFSQAIPSIFGAAARTADKTRRTTYIDKTSWLSDMEQGAINKVASKIPFLSMLRSEYVDEFGRKQDNANVFVRAIQNFISPGYISNIEYDPVIEDLRQLYKETGESVLPTKPKKYITVEGENIHLTAEQYEEYAIDVGQMRYEYIEEFFNCSAVNSLSAEEKQQVISNLYSYAQAKGKTHISKYVLPDIYKKAYKAEQDGLSPVYYYISKIATNEDNADFNGDKSVTKKEKLRAVRNMNISNDIKAALIALYR